MTARYIYADFAGTPEEARAAVAGTQLRLYRREGPNGPMVGALAKTNDMERAIRQVFHSLGWEDEFLMVKHYASHGGTS